jgi:hypothetical protein
MLWNAIRHAESPLACSVTEVVVDYILISSFIILG